jgi:Zn-dependent protease with chaperone function
MRDFFESQDAARKDTVRLIALFFLAVVLIIFSVYVATSAVYFLSLEKLKRLAAFEFWDSLRILAVCGVTLIVIVAGTLYKLNKLRGGGYKVAEMLGGRKVLPNTTDLSEKKLLNVVEEMAIASGVPVPQAYVMDKETGINAFVAGYGIGDAVVCVTGGCLKLLNRQELQAVVAHEFSHILNGDMALNVRLMGWLYGILLIGLIGEGILRGFRFRGKRGGGQVALLGLALFIIGYVGLFFGKVIKSAVSRQREYLADASAVQFTRNPHGLAGALKKIGGITFGSILVHPKAGEASHMFICDGVGGGMFSLMKTHPPLEERIRRIEPGWDGVFPKVKAVPHAEPVQKPVPKRIVPGAVTGAVAVSILQSIGAPMSKHADAARSLIAELPEAVREATREPAGARALIYVLLLDNDEAVRKKQIGILRQFTTPDAFAEADTMAAYLPSVPSRLRLPLVDLCVPALKTLSEERYASFKDVVQRLTEADDRLSTFEFVLSRVLIRHLDAHFMGPIRKAAQIYGIRGVSLECSVVLSMLARVGAQDEGQAEKAFASGRAVLAGPGVGIRFMQSGECTLEALDHALKKLAVASPLIKKKLMAACLETMAFDKTIEEKEAELFRAVGESLGVPVPPWAVFRGEG